MSLWNAMLRQFGVEMRTEHSEQRPRYRIVQEVEGLAVRYIVEEWTTHYACDGWLWLGVDNPCVFRTEQGARSRVGELLTPRPRIERTVIQIENER